MSNTSSTSEPSGELCIQTAAMPADTNPNGDIFGGWLLAQMDIAGGIAARNHSAGRVVTVAVESKVHEYGGPELVVDLVTGQSAPWSGS